MSEIEQLHLPPPDFRKTDSHMQATLFAPKPFGLLTREERVRACFQHACLCYGRAEALTNASLRDRFGLTDHTVASRVIKDALQEQWIKVLPQLSQSPKHRKYVPFWAE